MLAEARTIPVRDQLFQSVLMTVRPQKRVYICLIPSKLVYIQRIKDQLSHYLGSVQYHMCNDFCFCMFPCMSRSLRNGTMSPEELQADIQERLARRRKEREERMAAMYACVLIA